MNLGKKKREFKMRNAIRFAALTLAATLVLSVHTTAHGAIVAYQITSILPAVGNQIFGGPLGLDFTVNQSIAVLALGAFDSGQDGLNSPITVRLWQRTGNTGVQILGTGGEPPLTISLTQGTLIGGYRFVDLANPLTLTAGTYTISAEGYSSSELNFNANVANSVVIQGNTGGGLLSFTNSRFARAAGVFPAFPGPFSNASGPFVFGGPSFTYTPTPEPGTLLLIGSGLVGIGVGARRRNRRK